MKRCRYCAEEVQDAAIKCKHCGSMLNAPPVQVASPSHQGPLPDQIAHGLRRKQIQDLEYHLKVFGWLVLAGTIGGVVGSATTAKVGWIVFAIVFLGGGVSTARKCYG